MVIKAIVVTDIVYAISFFKHLDVLDTIFNAVLLVPFQHNKTPKVFCLTFGVHVNGPGIFVIHLELNHLEGRGAGPALAAVGDGDLGEIAHVVEDADLRAFVEDEDRLAALGR